MTTFFLTDANGQKHSITQEQLQALAAKGKIQPTTPLETDTGHKGLAGQIPGLTFPTAAPSLFGQPAQVVPPAGGCFCTNCGNPISEQAVACMSCGAKPIGHRKFCRQCGASLNPEQVVCVKCGAGISTAGGSRSAGGGVTSGTSKSRTTAALFALLLGGLGIHKFYMGSWGWGIIYIATCWIYVPVFLAAFEGIRYFMMTDEAFAEKYPDETKAPFRW